MFFGSATAMPMQPLTETDWKSLTWIESLRSAIACCARHACFSGRRVEQQHSELVTAEPRNKVRSVREPDLNRSATLRSKTSPAECPSPSLIALKSSRSRNITVGSSTALQFLADPRQEVGTVGEAGQRVVVGAVAELPLQRAVGGDVTQRQHDPRNRNVGMRLTADSSIVRSLAVGVQRGDFDRQRFFGRQLLDVGPQIVMRPIVARMSSSSNWLPTHCFTVDSRARSAALGWHTRSGRRHRRARRHRTSARRGKPGDRCRGAR